MTVTVELIYDRACPNVGKSRQVLDEAFAKLGISGSWTEWDRESPDSPDYARGFGSPTVLINGRDLAGRRPNEEENCCRLYSDGQGGFVGVPSVEQITKALADNQSPERGRFRGSGVLGVVPGIGASLVPVGLCPACWPAYAGLLSSLGLGFLLDTAYLLPIVGVFLALAAGTLAYRAKARRGYGPFCLGVFALVGVLIGKFALSSNLVLYLSVALLVGASIWNVWPKKKTVAGSCEMCVAQE